MPQKLRSVTLVGQNETVNADNVIGIDESSDSGAGPYVTAAVRCQRTSDIDLVEHLIKNDLKPFIHKSSSIVRYGSLSPQERASRASSLLADLEGTSITWAAIVSQSHPSEEEQAAAAAMAAKKSITNGLQTGDVSHGCGDTAIIHDGARDEYADYFPRLRKELSSKCDSSFQRNICPVYLTALQEADLVYPHTITADYIASYIREQYEPREAPAKDWVSEFDASWIDPAPQMDSIYQLKEVQPVREAALQSRVIAWFTGQGIPQDPNPTGQNPYQSFLDQIENERVYKYLRELK